MDIRRFDRQAALSALAIAGLSASSTAALEQRHVALIFNSQITESAAIAAEYLSHYPEVVAFDLDLAYPIITTNANRDGAPPAGGLNNQFITPARFEQLFRDPNSRFRQFLDDNPSIIAIATTRGLPAAISTDFDPRPTVDGDGIVGSFEAAISALNVTDNVNPYYAVDMDADQFFISCGVGPHEAGDVYLVSRLDSGNGTQDMDGDGDTDALDGVIQLIRRSVNLPPVDKRQVWMLIDRHPQDYALSAAVAQRAAGRMADYGWPVHLDETVQFLHGPLDPANDQNVPAACQSNNPPEDGAYFDTADAAFTADYPTLALVTSGRNHSYLAPNVCSGEPIHWTYTTHYQFHPAAYFQSFESFNGWRLHSFRGGYGKQGQALHFLTAGGSFTIGNVREPGTAQQPRPEYILAALYQRNRTWAEAVYAGLNFSIATWPQVGDVTPIGDPLARVTVFDPDVNRDYVVDEQDLELAQIAITSHSPSTADVNMDGQFDAQDIQRIADALARPAVPRPNAPYTSEWESPYAMGVLIDQTARCRGDLDGDGCVTFRDLNTVLSYFHASCPQGDVTGDGITNFSDLQVVLLHMGRRLADVNRDGYVNQDDIAFMMAGMGATAAQRPDLNLNCDELITDADLYVVMQAVGTTCR